MKGYRSFIFGPGRSQESLLPQVGESTDSALSGEIEVTEVPALDPRPIEEKIAAMVVQRQGRELAVFHKDLSTINNAVYAVESLIELVEQSKSEGYLSPVAAAAVNISLQSVYGSLDVPYQRLSVATEDFALSPRQSSELALEDLKERLKSLWQALLAALEKAINWLLGFLNISNSSLKRLDTRVKVLREDLKQVDKEDSAVLKQITNKTLAQALTPGEGSVLEAYQASAARCLKIYAATQDVVMTGARAIKKEMTAVEKSGDSLENLQKALLDPMLQSLIQATGVQPVMALPGEKTAKSGLTYLQVDLIGGVNLRITVPTSFEGIQDFSIVKERSDETSEDTIKLLSYDEVVKALDLVHRVVGANITINPMIGEMKSLIAEVKKMSGEYARSTSEGDSEKARTIRNFIQIALKVSTSIPTISMGILRQSSSDLLTLCDLSIKDMVTRRNKDKA